MSPGSYRSVSSHGSLEPGTHLCAFHQDEGQLTRIAATFIGQGLAAGDQLLYLVSSFADAYGTRRPDDLGKRLLRIPGLGHERLRLEP